jgi:opacity protein-like surface antigen
LSNRILFWLVCCGLVASASAQSSFNRFTYSAGGGLGIGRDDVAAFVGNSPNGVLGAGMNLTKMFGVDAEYMYYDLNFRPGVKESEFLSNQSGRMQSISLDGIVNVPWHYNKLSAYGILGLGFYRRSVSVPTHFLPNGASYQAAWRWWDLPNVDYTSQPTILVPVPPFGENMSSNSKDAGGFNYGGGVTYPLNHLHDAKLYLEFRYHRAYQSDGQTIVMPITVGLRW